VDTSKTVNATKFFSYRKALLSRNLNASVMV